MPKFVSTMVQEAVASKRVARWNPASRSFVWTAAAALGVAFISAFLVSAVSYAWAGREMGLPAWMAPWALATAVDGSLIASTLAAAARRALGKTTAVSVLTLAFFVLCSVGVNIAHDLSLHSTGPAEAWLHLAVGVIAPAAILACAESSLSLLVQEPTGATARERQAIQRLADGGLLGSSSAAAQPALQEAQASAIRTAYTATGRTATKAALARQMGVTVAVVTRALADEPTAVSGRASTGAVKRGRPAKATPALQVPDL